MSARCHCASQPSPITVVGTELGTVLHYERISSPLLPFRPSRRRRRQIHCLCNCFSFTRALCSSARTRTDGRTPSVLPSPHFLRFGHLSNAARYIFSSHRNAVRIGEHYLVHFTVNRVLLSLARGVPPGHGKFTHAHAGILLHHPL